MIYSSWDIECDRLKSVIMGHLLLFDLPPKKKKTCNFEKLKKLAGDIIILHMCTKKPQSYEVRLLRYRVRQTWFSIILGDFLPFYSLTNRKIKISNKWKNHLEMSSFYICVPKITIIWCMLPEIWSATDIIFCLEISSFYTRVP